VGRIYAQVRERPRYIVQAVLEAEPGEMAQIEHAQGEHAQGIHAQSAPADSYGQERSR